MYCSRKCSKVNKICKAYMRDNTEENSDGKIW